MTDNQEEGYILEVDLEYPVNLHENHGSFPLAPEKLAISSGMLSPYANGNTQLWLFWLTTQAKKLPFQIVLRYFTPKEKTCRQKNWVLLFSPEKNTSYTI